jgi:hypothetical protein
MIKDSFPLPCIDEMLKRMQGSQVFSKFDLKMGYNQLCIHPSDEWKMMFMTPDGPYMMNMMTFGFANTPPYFQQWMSEVLTPVMHQNIENYLDDTAMHHLTQAEHVEANRAVLEQFQKAGLFVNAKKCEFHQECMGFLGVEVSPQGFEMEWVKVDAVQEWQPPQNVKAV